MSMHENCVQCSSESPKQYGLHHEKTGFLPMLKQKCSNCEADQHLCFHYMDSTVSFLLLKIRNFKLLACFCACTDRFVWDLVGQPEDRFSRIDPHMTLPLERVRGSVIEVAVAS